MILIALASLAGAATIKVDPEGKTGPKTIGAAVLSARDGDLVMIPEGSFRESLRIDKNITLEGPGAEVGGYGQTVFTLAAKGATLRNLTIKNSGQYPLVVMEADNTMLLGCRLSEGAAGAAAYGQSTVMDNDIRATTDGVRAFGAAVVGNNSISGALGTGIAAVGARAEIRENNVSDCGTGIDLAAENIATGNRVEDSNLGIRARAYGIILDDNSCQGNRIAGIYLENATSAQVIGNLLHGNGNGIMLKTSTGILLRDNKATANAYGISMKGSGNNTLSGNVLENNTCHLRVEPEKIGDLRVLTPQISIDPAFNQSIDQTNIADGSPVCYLVGQRDRAIREACGFVGLIGCLNVTVQDQHVGNGSPGIMIVGSKHCRLLNCSASDSEKAVYILDSQECLIHEVQARNCDVGFWVGRSQEIYLEDCRAESCRQSGYRLEGARSAAVRGSWAESCLEGIYMIDALSCQVIGCSILSNQEIGLHLMRAHRAVLRDNLVSRNGDGISITGSNAASVSGNRILDNLQAGIMLAQTKGGTLEENLASGNREGIFLQGSSDLLVAGNNLSTNTRYGLRMSMTVSSNLTDNRLAFNGLAGASLTDCQENRIYHNDFVNNGGALGQNAVDNGNNQWDQGPQIGGNYWSDHQVLGNPGSSARSILSHGTDRYPFQDPGGWRI